MGWYVEIRFNDYEHVKEQMEEILCLKTALNKDELEDRLQMAIINQDDDEVEVIEEELADLRDEMESHMD